MPLADFPEIAEVLGRALVRPGEVERSWIDVSLGGRGRRPDGGEWWHVIVCGETFDFWLTPPELIESTEERADRLASDLQDRIAESRFGWGRQRRRWRRRCDELPIRAGVTWPPPTLPE